MKNRNFLRIQSLIVIVFMIMFGCQEPESDYSKSALSRTARKAQTSIAMAWGMAVERRLFADGGGMLTRLQIVERFGEAGICMSMNEFRKSLQGTILEAQLCRGMRLRGKGDWKYYSDSYGWTLSERLFQEQSAAGPIEVCIYFASEHIEDLGDTKISDAGFVLFYIEADILGFSICQGLSRDALNHGHEQGTAQ